MDMIRPARWRRRLRRIMSRQRQRKADPNEDRDRCDGEGKGGVFMEVFCHWRIKQRAQAQRVSGEALAEACNTEHTAVGRWMTGHSAPNANALPRLARALGCRVADFYETVPDEAADA